MDAIRQRRHVTRDPQQGEPKIGFVPIRERVGENYRLIKEWRPRSDVWPLLAGRSILINATIIGSLYINHRFRAKLKLRNYGTVATVLGMAATPGAMTAILHTEFIMKKLLLLEISCPLCMESKSALLQICSGVLLPLILAPIANFSIASGSGVYNVPYITDVRKIVRTVLNVYQPMFPKIAMLFTFHALLSGFITHLQIKSYIHIIDIQYLIKEEKTQKIV